MTRELILSSSEGLVHTVGDNNVLDIPRWGLENMGFDAAPERAEIAVTPWGGNEYDWVDWDAVPDNTVMPFVPAPAPVEDEYSLMAEMAEAETKKRQMLKEHWLVRKGFAIANLMHLGFDEISLLSEACRAANDLADLAGRSAVCKTLGWTGEIPQSLADFGVDLLDRRAGDLQAEVARIKAIPVATAPKLPPRGSSAPSLPPRPVATPVVKIAMEDISVPDCRPMGASSFLGTVQTDDGKVGYVCVACGTALAENSMWTFGFNMLRERQGRNVEAQDLWAHAVCRPCAREHDIRVFPIVQTREQCAERSRKAIARAQANQRPARFVHPMEVSHAPIDLNQDEAKRRASRTAGQKARQLARKQSRTPAPHGSGKSKK